MRERGLYKPAAARQFSVLETERKQTCAGLCGPHPQPAHRPADERARPLTQQDTTGRSGLAATAEKTPHDMNPLLKLGLEMGPLILFFLANARGESLIARVPALAEAGMDKPIFLATGVFMLAFLVSLGLTWALVRRLPVMPLVSGVVVLVFGGLTLYLQDELFIKLKPTIVNVLFGSVLLGGLAFGRPLLEYVFGDAFRLRHAGWVKLSLRWGLFFFFLAALNEVVWRGFSTDAWVAFKVWGVFPLTLAFAMLQMPVLKRYGLEDDEGAGQD